MPIYEYLCRDCAERFEQLIRSHGETVKCPRCGSGNVKKYMSLAHFRDADHWEKSMQEGLSRSKEVDDIRKEQKRRAQGDEGF